MKATNKLKINYFFLQRIISGVWDFFFLFFFLMRKIHDSSPEVHQKTTFKNLRHLIWILRHRMNFLYYLLIYNFSKSKGKKKRKKEIRRGIVFSDFFFFFGALGMINYHLIGVFLQISLLEFFVHLFAFFFFFK